MALIMDPVKVTAVATGAAGAGRNGKMTAGGRLVVAAGVDLKAVARVEKIQGARVTSGVADLMMVPAKVRVAVADIVSAVRVSNADAGVFRTHRRTPTG